MKNTLRLISGLLLIFVISLSSILAQSEKQMFTVHEDKIYPAHYEKYEEAVKNLISVMKEHNYEVPYIRSSSTRDFTYYYLTPIEGFADLDKNPWGAMKDKMDKEKYNKIMKDLSGHYEFHRNIVVLFDKELSYIPEKPRFAMEETKFLYWDFFYMHDGYDEETDELLKAYKKLYTEAGVEDSYHIYKSIFGAEYSLIIIVSPAKSFVDYAQIEANAKAKIGDKAKELNTKFLKILKKYDQKLGSPRPDLSYFPDQKDKSKK